jgi:kynurenine formamidase
LTRVDWHRRGGVVGRGVLIDYKAYADSKGIKYSCFENHPIPIKVVEEIAKIQGVTFKHGDIMLVRTGLTEALESKTAEEQQAAMMNANPGACGVQPGVESAKWFWNHHFAAVGGDAMGFESLDYMDMPNQLGMLKASKLCDP